MCSSQLVLRALHLLAQLDDLVLQEAASSSEFEVLPMEILEQLDQVKSSQIWREGSWIQDLIRIRSCADLPLIQNVIQDVIQRLIRQVAPQ